MSNDLSNYRTQNENKNERPSYYYPVLFAVVLGVGIFMGKSLGNSGMFPPKTTQENPDKISYVLNQLDESYVEEIDKTELIDAAIRAMLDKLDPHSTYISNDDYSAVAESMEGNFDGIGIEFLIVKDTLTVINPIEGGPSQKAGLQPGDQIITADTIKLSGTKLTNGDVVKGLKGRKGTKVELGIRRGNKDELLYYTITRDRIPIHSVTASFMTDENTGYIKLNIFSKNTFDEFKAALEKLNSQGMHDLIIDLRGNGGGYMNEAVDIISEFLDNNLLIVYTEERNGRKDETFSRGRGKYSKNNLVVLIDQSSASASEIVSGALQDHDRSITVGRRSFGKGLVQNEFKLGDNSAVRITIARYYTPVGRCIQKPYGEDIDYYGDFEKRYTNGELTSGDIHEYADSLKYETPKGRAVYGGGGITPDVFVPIDTTGVSHYYNELLYGNIFREFGFKYANTHSGILKLHPTIQDFDEEYVVSNKLVADMLIYAEKSEIEKNEVDFEFSKELIALRLKAELAKAIYKGDALYYILLNDDTVFQKGMEVLNDYNTFFDQTISRMAEIVEEEVVEEEAEIN